MTITSHCEKQQCDADEALKKGNLAFEAGDYATTLTWYTYAAIKADANMQDGHDSSAERLIKRGRNE